MHPTVGDYSSVKTHIPSPLPTAAHLFMLDLRVQLKDRAEKCNMWLLKGKLSCIHVRHVKWNACSIEISGIYVVITEAGSVVGIATGYGLDGLGIESQWTARYSAPVQTGPGAHPASCTMGTGSFPGVKNGRTWHWTLTPYPLLVPWSRKSRAIPLLPLWAVRPVQSPSACTRVHFTFTYMFL